MWPLSRIASVVRVNLMTQLKITLNFPVPRLFLQRRDQLRLQSHTYEGHNIDAYERELHAPPTAVHRASHAHGFFPEKNNLVVKVRHDKK